MPDVEGSHKGISNITHLKTNPPELHSLTQRTFYPRLGGRQTAQTTGPVAAPCRSQAAERLEARQGWGSWAEPGLCPFGPKGQANGPRQVPDARPLPEGPSWAWVSVLHGLIQYLTLQGDVDPFQ